MSNLNTLINLKDTKNGFQYKTNKQLKFRFFIFKMMSLPWLVKLLSSLTLMAIKLRLPVTWIIKSTIYKQFCGGETIKECLPVIEEMGKSGVKSILDYSSEAKHTEEDFNLTANQVLASIEQAVKHRHIVCACIKLTGVCEFEILEKITANKALTPEENIHLEKAKQRLHTICSLAEKNDVQVFIDAEESWIQTAIDQLAEEMMEKYNQKKPIVFTTLQMYRHDKIEYLDELLKKRKEKNYVLAVKLVRGAYLEKENLRAQKLGYPTPMQPSKEATDNDYNKALSILIDNIENVAICAGTHNEKSSILLTEQMAAKGLPNNHSTIQFSQLYGMSDHISYNLSSVGYNVTKYLPYGPVKSAIPYLVRRAQENTSIAGQMGNELELTVQEIKRRKSAKAG